MSTDRKLTRRRIPTRGELEQDMAKTRSHAVTALTAVAALADRRGQTRVSERRFKAASVAGASVRREGRHLVYTFPRMVRAPWWRRAAAWLRRKTGGEV